MTALAFVAVSIVWGASFLFIKLALDGFDPITLVAVRLSIGLVFLVVYTKLRHLPYSRDRRFWLGGAGIGMLASAFPFLAISWGQQFIESGIASILNSTTPLFTVLLAPFVNKADRLPLTGTLGVFVGFFGVLVLASGGSVEGTVQGMLAVIAGALSYALSGLLLTRHLRAYHFVPVITVSTASSVVVVGTLALLTGGPSPVDAGLVPWASVAALGLLGTGVAYVLFMYVIRNWGATRSSMITYLIPPIGVLLGTLVRHEPLTWQLLFGGFLIAAGVVAATRRQRDTGGQPIAQQAEPTSP